MTNYNTDFYGWTQEQAALLKSGRLTEIDIDNLVEEIETMGRSEKRELANRLIILCVHLLKWQYQPLRRGNSWAITICEQREEVQEILNENPSLKPQLDLILTQSYKKACRSTSKQTAIDSAVFPESCPWSFEQLMDAEFYPETTKI